MITTVARRHHSGLDPRIVRMIDASVSPLVGFIRGLGVNLVDRVSPNVVNVTPDVSDIHRRVGEATPPAYHAGGFGMTLSEAAVKAVAETCERTSLHTAAHNRPWAVVTSSQSQLRADGVRHVGLDSFSWFDDAQRATAGFPFVSPDADALIPWLPAIDLATGDDVLLPLEVIDHSYGGRPGETRSMAAMSNGAAAHVDYEQALRAGLLELLQVDAVMGHWYSGQAAPRIRIDTETTPRVAQLLRLYERVAHRPSSAFSFYRLPTPDGLPVAVCACVYEEAGFPERAVGQGVATNAEAALYHTFLEVMPIPFLAMVNAVDQLYQDPTVADDGHAIRDIDYMAVRPEVPLQMGDLDTNVVYYALPGNGSAIAERFDAKTVVTVHDAWPNLHDASIWELLAACLEHHEVYTLDMTSPDIDALGLKVVKVVCPDLLLLVPPGFTPKRQPRWEAYGGITSDVWHPYP